MIKELMDWIKIKINTLENGGHKRLALKEGCDGCARLKLYCEIQEEIKELAKKDWEKYKKKLMTGEYHVNMDYWADVNKDLEEVVNNR
jgi:hypothetical protein